MRHHRASLFLSTIAGFLPPTVLCVAVPAAPVVLTFEEIAPGGAVLSQFAAKGVTFNQATCRDYALAGLPAGFAHSGMKGIEQCFAQEFCSVPIEATFTAAQRRVKAWVGYSSPLQVDLTAVLTAFNAQGVQVGQATTPLTPRVTVRPINTPLEVVTGSRNITRVTLTVTNPAFQAATNSFAVDDFEFDTEGPPPVCNAATSPTITLTSPGTGSTTQVNSFILSGSVLTETPLTQATLTVTGPGGSTYTSDLLGWNFFPLNGGPFGPTRIYPLFPGSNTITVRAANCRGARDITRTMTNNPPPPGSQIALDLIEVTQSVQRIDNSVPLIAGKRTAARAYLRTKGSPGLVLDRVKARLFRRMGDGTTPGGPEAVSSLNSISVGPDPALGPRRIDIDKTLNFELPPEWVTEGTLRLEITGITIEDLPTNLFCENCANRDQFGFSRPVFLRDAPPLNVVLWNVPYVTGGSTVEPRVLDFDFLESWLRRAYPTARVLATRRRLGAFNGVPDTDFEAADVNSRLQQLRVVCTSFGSAQGFQLCVDTVGKQVHWYGLVSDQVDFMRGRARGIPGTVASGPAGNRFFGWDSDASYADWYGGHELAHTYGRKHPGFCGGNSHDDDDYPYIDGITGQTGFDLGDAALGLSMDVYPGNIHHDLMTYCDDQWMSDYTYEGIMDYLEDLGGGGGGAPLAEGLIIQGDLNLTRNQAQLRPFLRLPGLEETARPASSPFSVELRNAAEAVLVRHLFEPAEDTETEPGEDIMASFDLVVPWLPATRRIVVLRGGTELTSRAVSANAPQVRLSSPSGQNGFEDAEGILLARWEASDADGDPLTFTLLYSPDAGQSWHPIDAGLTSLRRDVRLDEIPGGDRAIFRIIATDGVNTASDDQDFPTFVPNNPPFPRILSPADNEEVPSDRPVILEGDAFDREESHLEGDALVWTSDTTGGRLGTGTSISVTGLAPGLHRFTLTATASDGGSGSVSVSVVVTAVPVVAVAEAESPVAPGTLVTLDGSRSSGEGSLRYEWELMKKPAGSPLGAVNGASAAVASFRPDRVGVYEIELRVEDSLGRGAVARVAVQAAQGVSFLRGDITGEGTLNISDPVRLLGWLFLSDPEPGCLDAADANDDGRVDLSDSVQVLSYLFLGNREIAPPFPGCGLDPTADALGCKVGCP